MNLRERSTFSELLDGEDIALADLQQNLKEIDNVNRWLGGFAITCKGFNQLAGKRKLIRIAEIGCGNGDNLKAIYNYAKRKGITVITTGIDIKQGCIALAEKQSIPDANWICSDYRTAFFSTKQDIIFSSLFCHHFSNEEVSVQLRWMQENASLGFFINDLQRHPIAYHSIKLLAKLFSRSYLFKNDAPLSVARSFTRKDWYGIIHYSGLQNVQVNWEWAFRYLIFYSHHGQ